MDGTADPKKSTAPAVEDDAFLDVGTLSLLSVSATATATGTAVELLEARAAAAVGASVAGGAARWSRYAVHSTAAAAAPAAAAGDDDEFDALADTPPGATSYATAVRTERDAAASMLPSAAEVLRSVLEVAEEDYGAGAGGEVVEIAVVEAPGAATSATADAVAAAGGAVEVLRSGLSALVARFTADSERAAPAAALPLAAAAVGSAGAEESAAHAAAAFAHLFGSSTAGGSDRVAGGGVSHGELAPEAHLPTPSTPGAAAREAAAALASPGMADLPASLRDAFAGALSSVMRSSATAAGGGGSGGGARPPAPVPAVPAPAPAVPAPAPAPPAPAPSPAPIAGTSSVAGGAGTANAGGGRPLRIAACQLHPTAGDVWANVGAIEAVLDACRQTCVLAPALAAVSGGAGAGRAGSAAAAAAAAGVHDDTVVPVDIAVFPEVFLQGYHIGATLLRATAVPLPSAAEVSAAVAAPFVSAAQLAALEAALPPGTLASGRPSNPLLRVAQLAAHYRTAVALSYAELGTAPDGLNPVPTTPPIYNAFSVFDADGALVAHYRKTHLWGAAYEKRVFTPGPGPVALPAHHPADDRVVAGATGPLYRWNPYIPFTLRAAPTIPIGLLVCFDLEFGEAARVLALRGAKALLVALGSGETLGLTSRKFVPTRAAENHMAVLFCNMPSAPLPEEAWAPGGARGGNAAPDVRVAEDAIEVAYAGGTTLAGPDGRILHSLPAYPCAPAAAPRDATNQVISSPAYAALQPRLVNTLLRPRYRVAPAGAPPSDEEVVIVAYDPTLPAYVRDVERNPYLADRRADLFGDFAL